MYNSAYREDIKHTMQNIPLDYTRNVVNGIRASFLSGPPPPPPVVIPPEELNPTYTFQITSIPGDRFIMPWEVKAFNFDDVRIHLNDTYTVITPHNGHDNVDPFDISRLFNDRLEFNAVWWNTKTNGPYPIVIQIGDQLFSVTIPTLEGDTLRDRQVKYFEITFDQDMRAPGLLILRNDVTVYDDGDFNNGSTRQIFTKRYYLPLPEVISPPVVSQPLTVVERTDQKLSVLSTDFASVDAVLAGVLQMSTTFQINISEINSSAHFMYIRGPPTDPNARMSTITILGQTTTTISIQIAMHYHYRGYRSARFDIKKNEMIALGYAIEPDGALRVFYNGNIVGAGGSFYQEAMPLVPFERVVTEFNIVTNMNCLLGDVAYYKVQKSDAFMRDIYNYYINQQDTDLIFGWKQGTLIDVVNSIPISIV